MKRVLAIAIGGVCLVAASHAWAQCASCDKNQLKCQDKIAKGLAKMVQTVIKCHIKQADAAFKGAPVDDEACETSDPVKSAKAKFDALVAKVGPLCTDQTPVTNAQGVETILLGTGAASLDGQNGNVYCDGSTPIDPSGDDTGNIATNADNQKCEDAAEKNISKLVANLTKCYVKSVDTQFKGGTFDLNFCINDPAKGAIGKYNATVAKIVLKPCPSCLDQTTQQNLGTTTATQVAFAATQIYPCSCGSPAPTKLSFTTGIGSGNCGSLAGLAPPTAGPNLACGGLYFGGGSNSVPLPATVPDMGTSVTKVTNVCQSALTLGPTANGELGATNRTCTKAGCFFGPPLPIPNTASTPTSTCVINTVSTDASGTADCNTGTSTINLPLNSEIYLAGDTDAGAAGIQPCPRCVSGTCTAPSPNAGMACTPGNSASLGAAYPTSHDCPPPASQDIGGLPIGFVLATGTITATAVAGTGGSSEARVFCGYCRDSITGSFIGPPATKCIDVTPGGPASGTCGSNLCEQANNGAFGPGGGGVTTISETGSAAGDLTDHALHNSTLVSIFCIPPTFNNTVDNAANLAGPGAVALEGQSQMQ